jgi:signal transduction histidine kinase
MNDSDGEFQERLERAKLDAMKELAYGASHEINNPLANISARAQTLLRDERDPDRRRALEAIHQQALRAHEMISDLMLFARPPRLELSSVDIGQIVRQVIEELKSECRRREIEISMIASDALPSIDADSIQLAVAVKAVCVNAVEAIGKVGQVQLFISPTSDAAPEEHGSSARLRIEVRDNGPGISPAARTHLFDPFFSGREAGRGLGFGLSKAWRIVTQHGGRLWAESPSEGAAFIIELPITAGGS